MIMLVVVRCGHEGAARQLSSGVQQRVVVAVAAAGCRRGCGRIWCLRTLVWRQRRPRVARQSS